MTKFIYPTNLTSRPIEFLAVTFEHDLPHPTEPLPRGSQTFRKNSSKGMLMFNNCIAWYLFRVLIKIIKMHYKKANTV